MIAAVAAMAAPALADLPLMLGVGLQTPTTTTFTSGVTSLNDFSLGYDVGPNTVVPIRVALEADYQSDTGGQRLRALGGGLSARLKMPLYIGAGFGVYAVSYVEGVAAPLFAGGGSPSTIRLTDTQVAPEVFIGQRIFSGPGVAIALQATYRIFPSTTIGPTSFNTYPSNVGLGLRVRL